MPQRPSYAPEKVRFGPFEANFRTRELRNNGMRIRITGQSFQVLQMLLDFPGDLVTREQLRSLLWPSDTFVDFEHGLNATVSRLREALNDSAERPRWVETLPRLGYRFIGEIERAPTEKPTETSAAVDPAPVPSAPLSPPRLQDLQVKAQPTPSIRAKWWKLVPLAVGASLGTLLAVYLARPHPKPAFNFLRPIPFTSLPGIETAPAFSPDGSRIAFAWSGDPSSQGQGLDLYVKAIGSETLLRLTHHPSEWLSPVWSPDGTQVAFHRMAGRDTGIYVVPALGGPERKLRSTHVPYPEAAPISWSPDGRFLAYTDPVPGQSGDRNFLLALDTLQAQQVPHNPSCLHEANLTFSTTADSFFYLCVHNMNAFDVYSLAGIDGTPRQISGLTDLPNGLAWSPEERRLVVSGWNKNNSELVEVPVAGGSPRELPVTPDASWPALSARGDRLAYSASSNSVNVWRRDLLHPELPGVKLIASTREQTGAQYSPDGAHIAFNSNRGGSWNIWMEDADGSNPVQITNFSDGTGDPNWSPDGKKVAFDLRKFGRYEIYVADVAERVPHKLETNVAQISSPTWSHDGKWIYFRSYEPVGHKLYRCPAAGGDAVSLTSLPDDANSLESFDGSFLYYVPRSVNSSLQRILLNSSAPQSAGSDVAALPPLAHFSQWTLIPGGVYFVPQDAPHSLQYYDFVTQKTRPVFSLQKDFADGLSVSPDGRYLLYSQVDEENSDIMLVDHFN